MSTAVASGAAGRRLSRESRIGLAVVVAVVAIRIVIGNFVVNDWEGWGTFVPTAIGAAVEGALLWGVTFGLLVHFAERSREDWPSAIAVGIGALAVLSLAIPYSAPQAVLGAGAVALGLVASDPTKSRRSRRLGRAAVVVGLLVIAIWLSLVVTTIVTDEWPTLGPSDAPSLAAFRSAPA